MLHLITGRPDPKTTPVDQALALYETACGQRLSNAPGAVSHWGFSPKDLRRAITEYAGDSNRQICPTCRQALEATR